MFALRAKGNVEEKHMRLQQRIRNLSLRMKLYVAQLTDLDVSHRSGHKPTDPNNINLINA